MRITLNGTTQQLPPGITVLEIIKSMAEDRLSDALGAMRGGEVLALNDVISNDTTLTLITFSDDEGRRIYERSLRLLFLWAVHEAFCGEPVRIAHSIGYGVFVKLKDKALTHAEVFKIERLMKAKVEQNAPILRGEGQMYTLDGISRPFCAPLLPDAGYLRAFYLRKHDKGLVMQMPSPVKPEIPAPYVSYPKHLAVFTQAQYWCEVLEATNAADINRMMRGDDFRQFIRVNEALHDKSIGAIADASVRRKARCILVAGPSSSGKTTFANRLAIHLRVLGKRPVVVSMDNFYHDLASHPRAENGTIDLEDIARLDLALFETTLKSLLTFGEAEMPQYDFQRGERKKTGKTVTLSPDAPVIIEGIHALNPRIGQCAGDNPVFKVYVSALSCVNMDDENRIRTTDLRLIRRIVRDMAFRNYPPNQTMAAWQSVRAGEDKWIFPFQETADVMFNTCLHYELPVLKAAIYSELAKVEKDNENYHYAERLNHILDAFDEPSCDIMGEIPPLSILREFIGGSTWQL